MPTLEEAKEWVKEMTGHDLGGNEEFVADNGRFASCAISEIPCFGGPYWNFTYCRLMNPHIQFPIPPTKEEFKQTLKLTGVI